MTHLRYQKWTLTAVAVAAILLSACNRAGGNNTSGAASARASSERIDVKTGTVENRVVATGKIAAKTSYSVAFTRTGTVAKKAVAEGDTVKAGAILAELDTRDLRFTADQQYQGYLSAQYAYSSSLKGPTTADLASAKSALNNAYAQYADLDRAPTESDIASLKATLMNAEATVKLKQAAYDREFGRVQGGIGGTQQSLDLESATNAFNVAKANYDAKFEKKTIAQYASASANISSAQAKIDSLNPVTETIMQNKAKMDQSFIAWQQAQENIKNSKLIAPADGLVTSVKFELGDAVAANNALVTVVDFSEPIFEMDVDEADLGNVKLGQDARVQLQTYPNAPIPAKVTNIAPAGTTSSNVVTYKVKITAKPTDPTKPILLGMSGTGEIVTGKANDAIVIPARALVIDASTREYSVLKVGPDGTTTNRAPVVLGYRSGDSVQILSGIAVGDKLAIPSNSTTTTNQGGPGGPPGG